jgi:hypothetical protein
MPLILASSQTSRRTSKTGQTPSSFGFIGAQIAISANEPVEDIPVHKSIYL